MKRHQVQKQRSLTTSLGQRMKTQGLTRGGRSGLFSKVVEITCGSRKLFREPLRHPTVKVFSYNTTPVCEAIIALVSTKRAETLLVAPCTASAMAGTTALIRTSAGSSSLLTVANGFREGVLFGISEDR